MTVTVYRSTDPSAPTLSGTAGSLLAVLDACLVTGYGSQPSSGWTKPFTGTNIAVFRSGTGHQRYLRIDDTGAQIAREVGYETMTGVNSGTGLFPTELQMVGGHYIWKSSTADATVRDWTVIATGSAFYLWINPSAGTLYANLYFFGDIVSYMPGDLYNTLMIGGYVSGSNYPSNFKALATQVNQYTSYHVIARRFHQVGSAYVVGKHTDSLRSLASTIVGAGGLTFPNPADGSVTLAPMWIHEPTPPYTIRGVLPGAWNPCHNRAFAHGDTFNGAGVGSLSGKTFEIFVTSNDFVTSGQVAIETSNTW